MTRLLLTIIPAAILLAAALQSCESERHGTDDSQPSVIASARDLERIDSVKPWSKAPRMKDPTTRMKVNYLGDLGRVFNDSNYVHAAAADTIGIPPLSSLSSHWNLPRPLVKITSCRDFFLEELTHSVPFLVPEAAAALHEIGRRFTDSVAARGGSRYRVRVTSVTRTPESVRRLRRQNVNAIEESVHQRATTVDISYARFIPDPDNPIDRSVDDLKGVLAEVLDAMRREGKIWVKYERKQSCFHITARPQH